MHLGALRLSVLPQVVAASRNFVPYRSFWQQAPRALRTPHSVSATLTVNSARTSILRRTPLSRFASAAGNSSGSAQPVTAKSAPLDTPHADKVNAPPTPAASNADTLGNAAPSAASGTTASSSPSTDGSSSSSSTSPPPGTDTTQNSEQKSEQQDQQKQPEGESFISSWLDSVLYLTLGFCGYKLIELLMYWPEPCQLALEAASTDPRVVAVLGSPIKRGWFWGGDDRKVDQLEQTDQPMTMLIPVSGPLGKGEIYARSIKANGRWFLLVCEVTFDNDRPVNVLEPQSGPVSATPTSEPASAAVETSTVSATSVSPPADTTAKTLQSTATATTASPTAPTAQEAIPSTASPSAPSAAPGDSSASSTSTNAAGSNPTRDRN